MIGDFADSMPARMFSCTVRCGKIMRPWGTKPSPAATRRWLGRPASSTPSSLIEPPRVGSMPISAFSRVVLPIPLRPMITSVSPASTPKLKPRITRLSP
jgi:hypothetical protein